MRLQMLWIEPLLQDDALLLQLGTHGRIDIRVRPTDCVAQLFGQHGKAAHESAADTENVNMHDVRPCCSSPVFTALSQTHIVAEQAVQ